MHSIWVVLPIKRLSQTKSRLMPVLTPTERADLTRHLAARTLSIVQQVPEVAGTVIVSRDEEMQRLGAQFGARCVAEPANSGLNTAVATGYQFVAQANATHALILPSDLPLLEANDVTAVCQLAHTKKMVIASDKIEEGTNALLLPVTLSFMFQYGRSSYQKHINEAQRHTLAAQIIQRPNLQFDLDTVQDWADYQHLQTQEHSPAV